MILRYLETYYKSRYLVSEVAIASRQRPVEQAHWQFSAKKLLERNKRYSDISPNVNWILTPTKVTAHRELLKDYIPDGKFHSWAIQLLAAIERKSEDVSIYFNPTLVSGKDDFFLCDSHWTSLGAQKYLEPVLASMGLVIESRYLRIDKAVHQGNCNFGPGDTQAKENTFHTESIDYQALFETGNYSVPDFSVKHGVNPNGVLGRVLVIHSSSYAYVRGPFRSLCSSIIEVFSPYVPASVIAAGQFDHVIIFMAERNCAVVYDGGFFSVPIVKSLDVPYIRDIASELSNFKIVEGSVEADASFMHKLADAWGGNPNEI